MSIKASIRSAGTKVTANTVGIIPVLNGNTTLNGALTINGTLQTGSNTPKFPGFKLTKNIPASRTELGLNTNTSPKTLIAYTKIINSPNDNITIQSRSGSHGGGDINLVCSDFSLSSDTLTLNGSQLIMGSGLSNSLKIDSTATGTSNLINVNATNDDMTINANVSANGTFSFGNNTPKLPGIKLTSNTPALRTEIGLGNVENKSASTIISEITASDIPNLSPSQITGLNNTPSGSLSLTASQVGLGNVTNESKATMFSSPTFTGNVDLSRIAGDNNIRIQPTTPSSGVGHHLYIEAGLEGTASGGGGGNLYLYSGQGGSGDGGDVYIDAASGDEYGQIRIGTVTAQRIRLGGASTAFTISNQSGFRSAIGLGSAATTASTDYAPAAGSSNISTVGTISTGTWQGTAIANAYVADLPTSKITSGTFANARIASSSVTQHSGNITSVGTLTSLTTSGEVNFSNTPSLPGINLTHGSNTPAIRTEIGLGNVTNQSKSTMFASPTFTGDSTFSGDVTFTQGAARTIKIARSTVAENGDNLTIQGGQYKSGTEGNGGDLTLKGGSGDSSDGNGGDLILSAGSGDTSGVIKFSGTDFLLTSGTSAQTAFRTAIGAGTGTYSDGSIINTNQVNAYANSTLFIRGKTGPTAYDVQITGGSESGDSGNGAGVTISGGSSGGDGGTGGDVTIQGGSGETTNGKVILGGSNTLQIDVNSPGITINSQLNLGTSVPVHADNTAATTAGLAVGDVYRNSTGQLFIVYT